jgi:hypothetical protein
MSWTIINDELREGLEKVLAAAVTDETMKSVKKHIDEITDRIEIDLMWRMKDDLARNLAIYCAEMAGDAVKQLLAGNEDQMRRYLSCEKRGEDGQYIGYTGRFDPESWGGRKDPAEQHPVIHGRLFEQGCVVLRKKIVEAHRDLITSERILDLEDQVQSLVAQNVKLIQERESLRERVRYAEPA